MSPIFAVVNGPNLNWLGKREPKVYGLESWKEIWDRLLLWAERTECRLQFFQSNREGELIDYLQDNVERAQGFVLNPAALAHTSVALRDCVAMLPVPTVEVHLSCLRRRESFRHHSYLADVVAASIMGFGWRGYLLGLEVLKHERS